MSDERKGRPWGRVKIGPRRSVANPWAKVLMMVLGELKSGRPLPARGRELLASVVGSYIMLASVPRRDREDVIRKLRSTWNRRTKPRRDT